MIVWVTTSAVTSNGEPRGWKQHAVESSNDTFSEIKNRKAACGLKAVWGADLFIDKKCSRCLRKLGIDCKKCKGVGSIGKPSEGSWSVCYPCIGTGEKKNEPTQEEGQQPGLGRDQP